MTAQTLVALEGVAKTYDNGAVALDGFDLTLRRGELLSLVGPSGCGKSTALRLVAGLARPTRGAIRWAEGARPAIGFVFQEPTLMPWGTVFDNVWLPLRLGGVGRKAAAPIVAEALARVGLGGLERAYPRELSGGMKMRVSIARALGIRPALLLMDEPFAALDEITRQKLDDDLARLRRELGMSVLFVTHSLGESVYLSDRIAIVAARPGRVNEIVAVEGPRARDESFRAAPAYVEARRAAGAALRRAMGEAA